MGTGDRVTVYILLCQPAWRCGNAESDKQALESTHPPEASGLTASPFPSNCPMHKAQQIETIPQAGKLLSLVLQTITMPSSSSANHSNLKSRKLWRSCSFRTSVNCGCNGCAWFGPPTLMGSTLAW